MSRGVPSTRAILFLRQKGVAFEVHSYDYRGPGHVAEAAAQALGVAPQAMVKTLVFQVDGKPVLALMDAASRVSLSRLAAAAGSKSRAQECSPADAERVTGYQVGGISPFGTRRPLPVFLDAKPAALPRIYVNGGSHGLIASMAPGDLVALLDATVAPLATD